MAAPDNPDRGKNYYGDSPGDIKAGIFANLEVLAIASK